jgi:putative tricarboxylic transport membrane protein
MNVDFGMLFHSYSSIFTLNIMFLIFVGVTAGIVIGALPGLTATMGVALLIPLTFGRPPLASLSMLMGIYTGAMYGGAISAILIRTPGTPAAAATVLEGYPMCQKGLAGSAMAMSLFASFVGGIIGCIIMIFMSPLISGFALQFGPVEYFALAIFGLSVIISVSGRSIVKGVIVGFFGLLLASMGLDPISGYPRFTFGFSELMEGPNFIPTLIGLFAVSEVIANIEKMLKTQKVKAVLNQYLPSWSDIKRSTSALIRGSLIGTAVGAIPGAGGDIAAFIAYADTKRSSKTPELFGTGMVEGVAATESANNSCQGGAMIPLLSLGVPGDAVTAVLLGAFVIQGLQPGPLLYKEHMDLVYAIFASMVVAQFVMQFVGMVGMRFFAKVIQIENSILMPMILVLSIIGSYAMRGSVFDVGLTIVFGIIGFVMQRYDFPLSPILLALILGPMAESNLRRAMVISSGHASILFSRPIAVVLMVLAVTFLVLSVFTHKKIERRLAELAVKDADITRT